jgi:hypothetical protein
LKRQTQVFKDCPFKNVQEVDKEEVEPLKEHKKKIIEAINNVLEEIEQTRREKTINIKTAEID